jgi:putative nucleotidyltransferase with HDIG domain
MIFLRLDYGLAYSIDTSFTKDAILNTSEEQEKKTEENKASEIVIVDDERDLAESLAFYLNAKGYVTRVASNGKLGYEEIKKKTPDAVISDIRMPEMDGIQLLKKVKEDLPDLPFILITGFAEILETQSAFDLGADGFLAKPFDMPEMMRILKDALEGESLGDTGSLDATYHGVDIQDFLMGSKINYPVYARLSDRKFIRIAHKGEDLSQSRVAEYRKKGVDRLYMLASDYKKYLDTLQKMSAVVQTNRVNVGKESRVEVIKTANNVIMEHIFSKELDEEVFNEAQDMFEKTVTVASEVDGLYEITKALSKKSDKLYAHSVCVSLFTMMILKKLGWLSKQLRDNAGLGAMFHDIGKRQMPDWLIEKSLIELNFEEKKELERHPEISAEMLQHVHGVSDEVIQIALQHHENCSGTGYPNAITRNQIHPLAKMVTIANEFMILVDSERGDREPQKYFFDAMKRLVMLKGRTFEADYFNAFIEVFDFAPEIKKLQTGR